MGSSKEHGYALLALCLLALCSFNPRPVRANESLSNESDPDAKHVPDVLLLMSELHRSIATEQELTRSERAALAKLPVLAQKRFSPDAKTPGQGPLRFLSLSGQLLGADLPIPPGGVRLLPVAMGKAGLRLVSGLHEISVVELQLWSRRGDEDVERQRLSLSRTLPEELAISSESAAPDGEAVRVRLVGPDVAIPNVVEITTFSPGDRYLDALRAPLRAAACGRGPFMCAETDDLRFVVDGIERSHHKIAARSVVGEVGGRVEFRVAPDAVRRVSVGAPLGLTASSGDPGRYKLRMRTRLVNLQEGGPPPLGTNVAEAVRIVGEELEAAGRVWGQCGVTLGPRESRDIQVVDPPRITLLEVGCRGALLAAGGVIAFELGGRQVRLETTPGQAPVDVARRLALQIERTGAQVRVYRNAQVSHDALQSYDLVIEDRTGRPAALRVHEGSTLSSDPSLSVCLGDLNLADGLEHFTDVNAAAGTREERMLLRALADRDPTTIDLIVVPLFSGAGRIGESFINSPGGSLMNALILDRGGIRAGARSLTLAHELGHILLEMPGHPDDFGVDTPTSLMDADAADPTIFGPRRLTLDDCKRMLLQSGPGAPVQLLSPWPLED